MANSKNDAYHKCVCCKYTWTKMRNFMCRWCQNLRCKRDQCGRQTDRTRGVQYG